MPDAIKRAIRTYIQAFIGVLIASGVLVAIEETGFVDWSALKVVVISAIMAGVIAVVSYVYNQLEDADVIPEALKR